MTALRRHVVAVVAALFALAVGIAIGGGPLSYVPDRDEPSTATAPTADPDDGADEPEADPNDEFAALFAASVASSLYNGQLLGHPTAILSMPGADPDVVEGMSTHVTAAGGGLTGVFELQPAATDLSETSLVDTLGSQLVTQLGTQYGDDRVDPTAPTYVRLGQLVALAVSTPVKDGLKSKDPENAVRGSLATAEILTSPEGARLAPLVVVVLPAHDADREDLAASAGVYRGLVLGLSANPVGLTVVGDTASAVSGLLAELREDDDVTAGVTTVDGADTGVGQVTAMLAVIRSLSDSVGSYGASGADGAVPLS
jgi:hypothetical protein